MQKDTTKAVLNSKIADRVKRVNIRNENPFFLISLIEYKSMVDYNVSMQIFRYMVQ